VLLSLGEPRQVQKHDPRQGDTISNHQQSYIGDNLPHLYSTVLISYDIIFMKCTYALRLLSRLVFAVVPSHVDFEFYIDCYLEGPVISYNAQVPHFHQ
jgi:hypothetical protein